MSAQLRLKSWIETLSLRTHGDPGNWDAGEYAGATECCAKRLVFPHRTGGQRPDGAGRAGAFHQQQISIPGEKSVIITMIPLQLVLIPGADDGSPGFDLPGQRGGAPVLDSGEESALRMSSILPARLVVRRVHRAERGEGKNLQALAQLREIAHQLGDV